MKMKKAIAMMLSAMIALGAMSGCGAAQTNRLENIKKSGVIKVATSPDFAPMEFVYIHEDGTKEYVGCDIELAKYIAEKLGVTLQIDAMEFSATQTAITTGSADLAISGYAKTPERAETMELSIPYLGEQDDSSKQGLLIKKDKLDTLTSAESFAGLKVGAQNGSLQYSLSEAQLPGAQLEAIGSLNDGILMLSTGKIDALAVSQGNGELFLNNYSDLALSTFYFERDKEDGNVAACKKGETELIEAVNEIIKEVNEKGLYAQWEKEAKELARSMGIDVD